MEMLIVILRSIAAGINGVVLATAGAIFVGLPLALYLHAGNSPSGEGPEVGWDLVIMSHDYPISSKLIPALAFAIGFLVGFRYFSKSLHRT